VPKMGHGIPSADVLSEVYSWLADDLERRRKDAKDHPGLAASATETATAEKAATRQVEEAQAELKKAGRAWRGVALLRAVVERWPNTDAGDKARQLLKDVVKDEAQARAVEEEGGKDERDLLTAQAKALERFGDTRGALRAWRLLAKAQPETAAGKKAADEAKRIGAVIAATPYLGIGFAPSGTSITSLQPRGAADKAGLKPGDKLLKVGGAAVTTQEQVRQELAKHKPGETIDVEVERGGKTMTLSVEIGSPPVED
jgi:C-terminal processing protease CtpA/Prc